MQKPIGRKFRVGGSIAFPLAPSVEQDGFKPPRSQAVDFLRNAVLDRFCGFKDSEKIRFSGFTQALVGHSLGVLRPRKAGKRPSFRPVCSSKYEIVIAGWRREWDSNPRYGFPHTRFPSVRLKPLGHLSGAPSLEGAPTILQGIEGKSGEFSATHCIYKTISDSSDAPTGRPAEPVTGLARRFTGSCQTPPGTP